MCSRESLAYRVKPTRQLLPSWLLCLPLVMGVTDDDEDGADDMIAGDDDGGGGDDDDESC